MLVFTNPQKAVIVLEKQNYFMDLQYKYLGFPKKSLSKHTTLRVFGNYQTRETNKDSVCFNSRQIQFQVALIDYRSINLMIDEEAVSNLIDLELVKTMIERKQTLYNEFLASCKQSCFSPAGKCQNIFPQQIQLC